MKNNLKTKVSGLLAVLMMLTCIPWTTPVTVSAATTKAADDTVHSYNLLDTTLISSGHEYVKIEDDGSWTVDGLVILNPQWTLDYTVYTHLIQQMEVKNGTATLAYVDRYNYEHWFDLSKATLAYTYYPEGVTSYNIDIESMYYWEVGHNNWWAADPVFNVDEFHIYVDNGSSVNIQTLLIADDTIAKAEVVTQPRPTTTTTATVTYPPAYTTNTTYATTTVSPTTRTIVTTKASNYTPNWTTTVSLMPATASEFEKVEANTYNGVGQIAVMPEGDGYRFDGTDLWPSAYYDMGQDGIVCNQNDDLYLNYDFEVLFGRTCINVYFGGQNPNELAAKGTFVSINGIIDPSCLDEHGVAQIDLPVGMYTGSVKISDLEFASHVVDEDGDVMFSGCKIFAVDLNSSVVVRELSIGKKKGEEDEKPIGDMSGDGELNTMDALLLFAVINGAKTATAEQQALADFNGDGVLNMMDALLLFKWVSGQ